MKKMDRNILLLGVSLLVIIVVFGVLKYFFNDLLSTYILIEFEWLPTLIIVLVGLFLGYILVGRRLPSVTVPVRITSPFIEPASKLKSNKTSSDIYHNFHYFEEPQLETIGRGMELDRIQLVISIFGVIITLAIIDSALVLVEPVQNKFYTIFLSNLMNFLVAGVFLLFIYLIFLVWKRSLVDEMKILLFSRQAVVSILCGIIAYSIFSILAITKGSVAWDGVVFGLALLLPFLLIAQLGGKYFLLFALHQWYQLWNWDLLKGETLVTGHGLKKSTRKWLLRILACIGIVSLPIGLLGSLIGIIAMVQNPTLQANSSLAREIITFLPGPVSIYVFIIGLGPLLTLFLKPLSYVEIWMHQGLYDTLGSRWILEDNTKILNKTSHSLQLPKIIPQLSINMFVMVGFILLLVGVEAMAPVVASSSPFMSQAIWLAEGASNIVFIVNVLFLVRSRHILSTLNLFATLSRRDNRNVINEMIFAENIIAGDSSLQSLPKLNEWRERSPQDWGMPYYELGNLYMKILRTTENLDPQVKNDLISKAENIYTVCIGPNRFLTKDMRSHVMKNLQLLKHLSH